MVDCQEGQAKSSPDKNEKIRLYTLSFKFLVVKHAKMSSIGAPEQIFGVDRKRIREWIQNDSKIQNKVSSKNRDSFAKRLDSGERKIKDMDLEEMLLDRIALQKSNNLRVSQKLIKRKARIHTKEKAVSKDQMNDFCASEGWLEKFMSRNGLSLCRCTTQAQKTPEQIIDKVISYILYVHQLKQRNNYDLDCIIAMNETAVCHEIISNTTVTDNGAKSVVLKTTGHEKSKVTVTLATKATGDKLKAYIVFPGHIREVQNLKKVPAIKN